MYGNRLTREYGDSAPSTWANAINSLSLHELERGMRRLLAAGSGSPPTLPQFVKACKLIGESEGPSAPRRDEHALPKPEYGDNIWQHGQKCLFGYLWQKGGTSEKSLTKMIVEKNRIVQAFQSIATEEKITGAEIRDALFKSWDKLWQPMPTQEYQRHHAHFERTGFTASWIDQQRSAVVA